MPDLCELNDVKSWLSMSSGASPDDALLQKLVSAVSAEFIREINRVDIYPAATFTEVREGDGDVRIALRHWPVNSVSAVSVAGSPISSSADEIASGYYIDLDLDPERRWEVYLAGGLAFTDGAIVSVTYSAGYAAVPLDIAQGVAEWVAYRFKSSQNIGTTAAHVQGESLSFQIVDMPPSTKAIVARYKRVLPGMDQQVDAGQSKGSRGSTMNPRV